MVLENLVSNASKYSVPGSHIDILLSKSPKDIAIAITDRGIGMTKQDMNKLFKKFTRLDNALSISVGGMGLGLYWAKRMLDLHHGSITVKSVPSQGSTFTITLPTVQPGKPVVARQHVRPTSMSRPQSR
jgi:two-component system sensor histidine kinase SenX3